MLLGAGGGVAVDILHLKRGEGVVEQKRESLDFRSPEVEDGITAIAQLPTFRLFSPIALILASPLDTQHRVCIFLGSEAIDWFLANGFASSREEGVQLGQVITIPIFYIVINTDCSTILILSGFLVLILLENPKS